MAVTSLDSCIFSPHALALARVNQPALELQALFKSQNVSSTEVSSSSQSSDATVPDTSTASASSSSSSSSSAAAASEPSSIVVELDPLESLEACRAAFQKVVVPTFFVKTPVTVRDVCAVAVATDRLVCSRHAINAIRVC
jgi:hypothetical protein